MDLKSKKNKISELKCDRCQFLFCPKGKFKSSKISDILSL